MGESLRAEAFPSALFAPPRTRRPPLRAEAFLSEIPRGKALVGHRSSRPVARDLAGIRGRGARGEICPPGGRGFNGAERDAFAVIERMALRFSLADRVLISSPMWNFGVPYKLKQWFDLIVQPGLTFTFSPAEGYRGLLKDRPTIVILASGSDFVTGMNRGRVDMATPYLRDILRLRRRPQRAFRRHRADRRRRRPGDRRARSG